MCSVFCGLGSPKLYVLSKFLSDRRSRRHSPFKTSRKDGDDGSKWFGATKAKEEEEIDVSSCSVVLRHVWWEVVQYSNAKFSKWPLQALVSTVWFLDKSCETFSLQKMQPIWIGDIESVVFHTDVIIGTLFSMEKWKHFCLWICVFIQLTMK